MKRTWAILVAGLAILTTAAAAAAASAPRAQLQAFVCQKAVDPPSRAVSVTAVMRPLTGTEKMEMEAQLLSRTSTTGSFAPVSVPAQSKLGSWITPANPTLGQRPGDVWEVQVPVANLGAPATYRYKVDFRWLGTGGKVLGTAQRLSQRCYEPELRPYLYVQSFTVEPVTGHPKVDQYVAVIGNSGLTAAKVFEVQFSDVAKTVTDEIQRLASHAQKTLTFTGPACEAAAPPTVTLDPQHVVDDLNTTKLTATATCPAPATGTAAGD